MTSPVLHLVAPPGSGARAVRDLLADADLDVRWSPLALPDLPTLAADPGARFLLVARPPALTVAASMAAWATRRYVTEPDLPGWWGDPWSFPLIEGWEELIGAPLAQVCAAQYAAITTVLLDEIDALAPDRWEALALDRLAVDPAGELCRALTTLGLPWDGEVDPAGLATLDGLMETAAVTLRGGGAEIDAALEGLLPVVLRMRGVVASRLPGFDWEPMAEPAPEEVRSLASEGTPFSSEHTSTVPQLLAQARASMVITTYKSGHVIVARAEDSVINTEFTSMPRPMGVAVAGTRLAVGTAESIVCFTVNDGLAPRVPSQRTPEGVYAPRSIVFTGDIAIHDMAYGGDGALYFVNTKFSCLCRQDLDYSFVPVWRPQWISGLAAEDRCHLNGLAIVNGVPRYVTALARTDTAHGWRELKGTAGVLVDVTTDEIVSEGLSMPHSPRWHDGRLWVLESGIGALCTVDVETGERTVVATLPGFTRGLSFLGPYALVGLSQVRESVFSALPITATAAERNCGVWVVDTRSGEIVGFLRFSGMVQEIFEVAVVPGAWAVLLEAGELTLGSYVLPDEALRDVVSP